MWPSLYLFLILYVFEVYTLNSSGWLHQAIVDPYVYIDRLTMPKLLISSSNDEFFLLDDTYCTIPTLPTPWNMFSGSEQIGGVFS